MQTNGDQILRRFLFKYGFRGATRQVKKRNAGSGLIYSSFDLQPL